MEFVCVYKETRGQYFFYSKTGNGESRNDTDFVIMTGNSMTIESVEFSWSRRLTHS